VEWSAKKRGVGVHVGVVPKRIIEKVEDPRHKQNGGVLQRAPIEKSEVARGYS
jgi:hypothetical protein